MAVDGIRIELTITLAVDEVDVLKAFAEKVLSDQHWGRHDHQPVTAAEARLARKLTSILSPPEEGSSE